MRYVPRRGFVSSILIIVVIFALLMIGAIALVNVSAPQEPDIPLVATSTPEIGITYTNTEFGFEFVLPKAWEGYTIVTSTWSGGFVGSTSTISGPSISIRNPLWTSERPYQDIPIMIFTHEQWEAIAREKLSVSAAPIGPKELGRNNSFIFALPARYNFAYPAGYEDVEDILQSNPLRGL